MKKILREIDSKGLSGSPLPKSPFSEVKITAFTFSGPKSREEVAYVQYQLLLKPDVLQAHIDFNSKKGIVATNSFYDASGDLFGFGLNPKFVSMKWLPYADFVSKNNRLPKK